MRHFIFLGALLAAPLSPALAQSTVVLVEPYQAAVEDKANIEKRELPALKSKELELGNVFKGQEEELSKTEATYHDKVKARDDIIASWDNNPQRKWFEAQCANRVVEGEQYRTCKALQETLQGKKNTLEVEKKRLEGEATQASKRHNELLPLVQESRNDLVLNRARQQKLRNWVSQLDARILAVKQLIISQCTSVPANASYEEIKHKCGNIQIDGARFRQVVPPCETERCKEFDRRF